MNKSKEVKEISIVAKEGSHERDGNPSHTGCIEVFKLIMTRRTGDSCESLFLANKN
jgi:hypothetical protein